MKFTSDNLLGRVYRLSTWTDAHFPGDQLVRHSHTVTVTGVDYRKNTLRAFEHGSRTSQDFEFRVFAAGIDALLIQEVAVAPYGGEA